MVKVQFTKDFASKKKGDFFECDSQLASHLVNVDKVAVMADEQEIAKSYNAIQVELREAKEQIEKLQKGKVPVKDTVLEAVQSELTTANESLVTANDNLEVKTGELNTANDEIGRLNTLVETKESELTTANESIVTANEDLKDAQEQLKISQDALKKAEAEIKKLTKANK